MTKALVCTCDSCGATHSEDVTFLVKSLDDCMSSTPSGWALLRHVSKENRTDHGYLSALLCPACVEKCQK